jgi:hypothetical protein
MQSPLFWVSVQGTPFIDAARSQLSGEFRGVLSTGKLMQNPKPIVFEIRGASGMLSRCEYARRKNGIRG